MHSNVGMLPSAGEGSLNSAASGGGIWIDKRNIAREFFDESWQSIS